MTIKTFSTSCSGLPPEALQLLRNTPGSMAVLGKHPNGCQFVRVFSAPDPAEKTPDWTHEWALTMRYICQSEKGEVR